MGKLVRLIGSGIGSGIDYTSGAIQAARNRPSSKDSTSPTARVDAPTRGNGEYIPSNEGTGNARVQEQYAELLASPIHHECAELPAAPIHEVYAELPGSAMDGERAELPGVSATGPRSQPSTFPDEKYPKQTSHGDSQVSEQGCEPFKANYTSPEYDELNYSNRLQRGIEPDVAFDQHDRNSQRVGLPTYSESEIAVGARFSATGAPRSNLFEGRNEEDVVRKLVQAAGPVNSLNRIPHPVVISQCEPGDIDGGFVRAYAPVLADCGISQDLFTGFQEGFAQASMASSSIEVVSVAADIVGGVPETASLITGMLAQIAAGTARETIFHCGARTFLQRVNQDLFMPRGLCVMVMALKDNVLGPQHGPLGPLSQKLGEPIFAMEEIEFGQPRVNNRLAGGNREVQTGLPQAAPLVYPDLDLPMTQAINNKRSRRERVSPGSCGACQGLKVAGVWVQDYVEKKAQESNHQSSQARGARELGLAHRLGSGYSSHPAKNGKLISSVSGGRLGNKPGLIERAASSIRESQELKRGNESPNGPTKQKWQNYQDKNGPAQGVQHLFVVNVPTGDEVQQSIALLELLLQQTGRLRAH